MSSRIEKQFTNAATTPILITMSFELNDDKIIERIDARKAYFVSGSDVLGPMGHEFVPLANKADADDFLKDHKGKKLYTFERVTPAMANALDNGRFD